MIKPSKVTPEYLFSVTALFCLMLMSIFLRAPWFTQLILDWDESTFILVSQSILDGHLPYTEMFDIKGPLNFFVMAIPLIFGRDITHVRFFASLIVGLTSFFIFLSAKRATHPFAALSIAFLYPTLTILYRIRYLSSEIIAVLFLTIGVYLTVKDQFRKNVFWIAFTFSLAGMTRTNLVYFIIIISLYLLSLSFHKNNIEFKKIRNYALGGISPIAFFLIIYSLSGNIKAFFTANVSAALAYSNTGNSIVKNLSIAIGQWQSLIKPKSTIGFTINLLLILSIFSLFVHLFFFLKNQLRTQRQNKSEDQQSHSDTNRFSFTFFILLTFLASLLATLATGQMHKHYMIQCMPLLLLLLSLFYSHKYMQKHHFAVFPLLLSIYINSYYLYKNYPLKPSKDSIAKVGEYLKKHHKKGQSVFFYRAHILSWTLDIPFYAKPIVHPSVFLHHPEVRTVFENEGIMPKNMFESLLKAYPDFIVIRKPMKKPLIPYYKKYIRPNYKQVFRAKRHIVYRLKKSKRS